MAGAVVDVGAAVVGVDSAVVDVSGVVVDVDGVAVGEATSEVIIVDVIVAVENVVTGRGFWQSEMSQILYLKNRKLYLSTPF